MEITLSVQMSYKCTFSLTNDQIRIKPYKVVVYSLNKCMKDNNPGSNYFKGYNK